MRAMILAAGRGERMRPLTDTCPKPLLKVGAKPLIEYHIEKLVAVGVTDIVINYAWLGEQLVETLGDGSRWHIRIHYSAETEGALETAGGICKALPLLVNNDSDEPFIVVNGDIYIDYDFRHLPVLSDTQLAHLWLTENPEHNLKGDFGMSNGMLQNVAPTMFTFSGLALYRPSFFNGLTQERVVKLAPLIRQYTDKLQVGASMLEGKWMDVGTPERLKALDFMLSKNTI